MAALAVGAVREQVEDAQRLQLVAVLVGFVEREVVLFEVGLDELLQRPLAERRLDAQDGERHQVPPERLAQLVGRDLTLVEPIGEVPQGSLPAVGLVDGLGLLVGVADIGEERAVRAPGHAAEDGDLTVFEHVATFG